MQSGCGVDAVRCSRTEQLRLMATHKGSVRVLSVIGSQRMRLPHVRIGLMPVLSLTDECDDTGGPAHAVAWHTVQWRAWPVGPLPLTRDTECRRRAWGSSLKPVKNQVYLTYRLAMISPSPLVAAASRVMTTLISFERGNGR